MGHFRPQHEFASERSLGTARGAGLPTFALRERAASASTVATDALVLAGLTVVAVALRLVAMRGLWVDEAIAIHQASLPFGEMLDVLRSTDRHPPLYFVLLWLDVRQFGMSELAVRIPSIAAGSLLVPALYLTGRELWGRGTGLAAAAFGTVAPLIVWYSQEARMYALLMLFSVLSVWAQARAIRRGTALDWALYVATAGLLLWTHYFALLQVVVQQCAFGVVAWRRAHRGLPTAGLLVGALSSLVLLAAITLPLFVFAGDQLAAQPGVSGLSDPLPAQVSVSSAQAGALSLYRVITNGGWAVWGYHAGRTMSQLGALWPFAMLGSLVLLGRRCSESTGLVLAVALVPPAVLGLASLLRPELFEIRYFAATAPMAMLLLARATTAWSTNRLGAVLIAGAIAITLVVGLEDQQLSGSNPRRYDFRASLQSIARSAGPQDVVVYAPRYLRDLVSYYAPHVRARALRNGLPPLPRHRRVYLVASFLDHPSVARRTGKAVWQLDRHETLVGRVERHRVTTWAFR